MQSEKIEYIETPSINRVYFADENIGKQWRPKYIHYYKTGVHKKWTTPIFVIQRQFIIQNGFIFRTQFPLTPASAHTINKSQGYTFDKISIDMDMSKMNIWQKYFCKHAQYVSASRVKSLDGLQIINLNKNLVSVNPDVKNHMNHMLQGNSVQQCNTPLYTTK